MLTIAHAGQPLAPHDLWTAWSVGPLLGIALLGFLHHRGQPLRRGPGAARRRCFVAALVTLVVALATPLDALSGSLASAHMVQHVLLVLVAAPLLAAAAPSAALLRGSPVRVRRTPGMLRRRLGISRRHLDAVRHPAVLWLLHVATVWFWHAAVPYDAAVANDALHVLEHASFLLTGWAFWQLVLGGRRTTQVTPGLSVLLVFGMAVQGALLSALMTFSPQPWYASYLDTTAAWGLDPLADQHLAGAIMWVPGGFVYPAVALALMVGWLRGLDRAAVAS